MVRYLLCMRYETFSKMVRYDKGLTAGHHYETSFLSHFWHLEFGNCSYILGRYVTIRYHAQQISFCLVEVNWYFYKYDMQN